MVDYELIDAGEGARLERFRDRVVQRPYPPATGDRRDPRAWLTPDLVHEPGRGWHGPAGLEPWSVSVDGVTLELRPTPTGQVGFFPEHVQSWPWLRSRLGGAAATERPSVLNLFAYTGATTLALAAAGASVVHVDAARPAVAWARRNAELSGLAGHPVRWLVDDVPAFVARELRRGRRYDGVVLDPPTYGHGPRARSWRLETDLDELLAGCARLVGGGDGFLLLTAHTAGVGPAWLGEALATTLGLPAGAIDTGVRRLEATTGAALELGAFARWPGAR